ncbi:hypothetical protein BC828DRAFT_375761 [Blastocladiella britannica]|nr:hypothetical protein BC828DRAFT_375761 [Blastocladiella britannica]
MMRRAAAARAALTRAAGLQQQRRVISTATISKAAERNLALAAAFDLPPSNTSSLNGRPVKRQRAVGLMNDPALASPQSMVEAARAATASAHALVASLIARGADGRHLTLAETHTLIDDFDALSNALCCVTDTAELLRNLHPDRQWSAAADAAYASLSSLLHTLNTDHALYAVLRSAADAHAADLPDLDARNAAVFLRDFETSGIHLPEATRRQHVEIADQINHHARDFFAFEFGAIDVPLSAADCATLPPDLAPLVRTLDEDSTSENFRLAMSPDTAARLVTTSPAPAVRGKACRVLNAAFPQQEAHLQSLLASRHHMATLVGFPAFNTMFLKDKMVHSPTRVLRFLDRLARESQPRLDRSFAALARENGGRPVLEPDRGYLLRQIHLREVAATMQQQNKRTSLPTLGTAMAVFADTIHAMYGVTLSVAGSRAHLASVGETWYPDVVKLVVGYQGRDIGTMYCDLVHRTPPKLAAAAHFTVRGRRVPSAVRGDSYDQSTGAAMLAAATTDMPSDVAAAVQRPVVVLATSLPRGPGAGLPWTQVETLWHELGHAVHSLLSFTPYQNVSGTRCALDVSEVPSILMELVLAHPAVQARFADTQPGVQPIPRAAQDEEMMAGSSSSLELDPAKVSAATVARDIDQWSQIVMAALDQVLHSELVGPEHGNVPPHTLVAAARSDPALLPMLAPHPSLCAALTAVPWDAQWAPHLRLQHLATYSAGYYTYAWSRVVAHSIYNAALRDAVSLDELRPGGMRIWTEFLGWGGGRDPWACIQGVVGNVAPLRRYIDKE